MKKSENILADTSRLRKGNLDESCGIKSITSRSKVVRIGQRSRLTKLDAVLGDRRAAN